MKKTCYRCGKKEWINLYKEERIERETKKPTACKDCFHYGYEGCFSNTDNCWAEENCTKIFKYITGEFDRKPIKTPREINKGDCKWFLDLKYINKKAKVNQ